MTYEELLLQHEYLTILETDLSHIVGLKGLYVDECIAIEKKLSYTEKACILAEEIGHHFTSSEDILDQSKTVNRKQEKKARMWAYNIQIGLVGIINAYNAGCSNLFEIAEYLDVTEDFLSDALESFRKKFGVCTVSDNYIIYFEPSLGVMKLL
ncbi:MAG: phage protein [Neobacillus sp.]|nr:phage protein [Neobacillus sp.]